MKMLPPNITIEVRWSTLGNPTTPGEHRPSALGGDPVQVNDIDIIDANTRGGDPFVKLTNSKSTLDAENYWVISKFV